ncbi:UAP56-interacting factor isoform X2 [Colius striatus]|uniref:UAP56-interacting factor isoform X2 n=1 Tax=Colius striatus TaxID=57412 RepID=UPI002B1D3F94|nr:UAP56-interacting factor isoform X2 [Colius striatus]
MPRRGHVPCKGPCVFRSRNCGEEPMPKKFISTMPREGRVPHEGPHSCRSNYVTIGKNPWQRRLLRTVSHGRDPVSEQGKNMRSRPHLRRQKRQSPSVRDRSRPLLSTPLSLCRGGGKDIRSSELGPGRKEKWGREIFRNNTPSAFARIGNKLSQQKDTRQATFLFRRGLKVQAQVQSPDDLDNQTVKRTRQWRTSTTSGGILTVSIDNPGAIITPISQKLRLTRNPVPPFLMKRDQSQEKKIPKGVPLQFDINSVGKQTGMTLNERFGILKEKRTALSQNKGSRFVTVG